MEQWLKIWAVHNFNSILVRSKHSFWRPSADVSPSLKDRIPGGSRRCNTRPLYNFNSLWVLVGYIHVQALYVSSKYFSDVSPSWTLQRPHPRRDSTMKHKIIVLLQQSWSPCRLYPCPSSLCVVQVHLWCITYQEAGGTVTQAGVDDATHVRCATSTVSGSS